MEAPTLFIPRHSILSCKYRARDGTDIVDTNAVRIHPNTDLQLPSQRVATCTLVSLTAPKVPLQISWVMKGLCLEWMSLLSQVLEYIHMRRHKLEAELVTLTQRVLPIRITKLQNPVPIGQTVPRRARALLLSSWFCHCRWCMILHLMTTMLSRPGVETLCFLQAASLRACLSCMRSHSSRRRSFRSSRSSSSCRTSSACNALMLLMSMLIWSKCCSFMDGRILNSPKVSRQKWKNSFGFRP